MVFIKLRGNVLTFSGNKMNFYDGTSECILTLCGTVNRTLQSSTRVQSTVGGERRGLIQCHIWVLCYLGCTLTIGSELFLTGLDQCLLVEQSAFSLVDFSQS
uniref:Uncharacterized protein n=1 Tax=Sphaerodactylus townsendi TaxID=933632 RepID=A0ACB8E6L0_9SAUR